MGSTYLCENVYSEMNFMKSKYRSSLYDCYHLKTENILFYGPPAFVVILIGPRMYVVWTALPSNIMDYVEQVSQFQCVSTRKLTFRCHFCGNFARNIACDAQTKRSFLGG